MMSMHPHNCFVVIHPADLVTLTNGTGSSLTNWVPGAAMDYEKAIYHEKVPLEKAMIFLSVFKKD
jgi:hypothetical protein